MIREPHDPSYPTDIVWLHGIASVGYEIEVGWSPSADTWHATHGLYHGPSQAEAVAAAFNASAADGAAEMGDASYETLMVDATAWTAPTPLPPPPAPLPPPPPPVDPLHARWAHQTAEARDPDTGAIPAGWEPTGTRHNPHWANND